MNFDIALEIFDKNGLEINQNLYELLLKYANFLVQYNNNVNLTAITDLQDIFIKHFLDSVLPLNFLDLPQLASLVDVGAGAGFPSVPLKIFRQDLDVTAIDSLQKRITFLNSLRSILNIDLNSIHARAEDVGKNLDFRQNFDAACARAVAPLSILSEYCIPLLKIGGCFFALKGPNEDVYAASNAISTLGGEISHVHDYSLNDSFMRKLVIIRKISQTPTKYPRNSAQIKRFPL